MFDGLAWISAIIVATVWHELGHFLAAWCKTIPVEKIGFSPLGVFVGLSKQAFRAAPPLDRLFVVLAGPLNNFVLAAICSIVINTISLKPNVIAGGICFPKPLLFSTDYMDCERSVSCYWDISSINARKQMNQDGFENHTFIPRICSIIQAEAHVGKTCKTMSECEVGTYCMASYFENFLQIKVIPQYDYVSYMIPVNFIMGILNLLALPGFDGFQAWVAISEYFQSFD